MFCYVSSRLNAAVVSDRYWTLQDWSWIRPLCVFVMSLFLYIHIQEILEPNILISHLDNQQEADVKGCLKQQVVIKWKSSKSYLSQMASVQISEISHSMRWTYPQSNITLSLCSVSSSLVDLTGIFASALVVTDERLQLLSVKQTLLPCKGLIMFLWQTLVVPLLWHPTMADAPPQKCKVSHGKLWLVKLVVSGAGSICCCKC